MLIFGCDHFLTLYWELMVKNSYYINSWLEISQIFNFFPFNKYILAKMSYISNYNKSQTSQLDKKNKKVLFLVLKVTFTMCLSLASKPRISSVFLAEWKDHHPYSCHLSSHSVGNQESNLKFLQSHQPVHFFGFKSLLKKLTK